VRAAWDIEGIRRAHEAFIQTWSDPSAMTDAASAVVARTMLVADWLELLREDPRLPPDFMDEQWPAATSFELYRRRRAEVAERSDAEFAALTTPRKSAAAAH